MEVLETLAGRETTVLGSKANLDLAGSTANYGSTARTVNWGFGEWEYLVSMYAVVVEVVVVEWVVFALVVMAGFEIGVEVFDKATTATG